MIVVKRNCILTEKEKKHRSELSNYNQRPTKMEWKGLCLKYAVNNKAVKKLLWMCVNSIKLSLFVHRDRPMVLDQRLNDGLVRIKAVDASRLTKL